MSVESVSHPEDPRQKKRYYIEETVFRRIAVVLLKVLFRAISQMEFLGTHNLPQKGPVVLVANHLTNFDVFPMQFALKRPIFFMAKSELHQNPLLDIILRQLGSFPVQRGARDEWAMRHAQQVLKEGHVLGIFPEGTRSKGRGLRTAKTGAARLAIGAPCPIVPVTVVGTHQMWREFPRRTNVTITIGEPIYPVEDDTALSLTDHVMFTLASMLPPALRGVYAERPPGF